MASNKVVINLATGLEDSERVTVAFLVGGAAVEQGKQVVMFLTLQGPQARRESARTERPTRRRNSAVGMDRGRRCHRVQLLSPGGARTR